jgi:hypothetical protein
VTPLVPMALLLFTMAAEPLTNEDVVRRFLASGNSIKVIETIEAAAACDFDLSDPMIQELRAAGIPAPVIDAMRDCASRIGAPATPDRPGPQEFRIQIAGGEADAAGWRDTFAVPGTSPDASPPPDGLMFLVACLTPEHVPDHWRSATQLRGRGLPRHRLVATFDSWEQVSEEGIPIIHLTPTEHYTIKLETGSHRLAAGVAARLDGAWRLVVLEDLAEIEMGAPGETEAWIRMSSTWRPLPGGGNIPIGTVEVLPGRP